MCLLDQFYVFKHQIFISIILFFEVKRTAKKCSFTNCQSHERSREKGKVLQSQIINRRKTAVGKEVTLRGKDPGRGTGIVSLVIVKTTK